MAQMTEEEFARKAGQEYSKLSDREKERVSATEDSRKSFIHSIASRIWQGVKEVGKAVIAGLATAIFG